jgi:protein SCO1/2
LLFTLACLPVAAAALGARPTTASATATYSSRGVVRGFAPERRLVFIAHETIPGYMDAMTMSFEARSPAQLAGLAVGDRVTFSFVATDDGRRLLNAIARP